MHGNVNILAETGRVNMSDIPRVLAEKYGIHKIVSFFLDMLHIGKNELKKYINNLKNTLNIYK